jgi:hypothetical protein
MSDSEEGLILEVRRLERELRESRLSLRDEFAGRAMQGWLASYSTEAQHPSHVANGCKVLARGAYAVADAMMEEREVKK